MTTAFDMPNYCLSGLWLLDTAGEFPRLQRPSDGTTVELEEADTAAFGSLWSTLSAPTSRPRLRDLLRDVGDDSGELCDLFLLEQVVRERQNDCRTIVSGRGPLTTAIALLCQQTGWRIPRVHCFEPSTLYSAVPSGVRDELAFCAIEKGVIATGQGCQACVVLRTLGAFGGFGEDQTPLLTGGPSLEPELLAALTAGILCEVERLPLGAQEGIWLRSQGEMERGRVLAHPDCPYGCGRRDGASLALSFQRTVAVHEGRATTSQRIAETYGTSPFAPLVVREITSKVGRFPLNLPFVVGDTRLSRFDGRSVVCTSLAAIAHGSSSSAEHSHLLTWSEGVERLGAQTARPDLELSENDARSVAAQQRYGWPQSRQFCIGFDLIRRCECIVPLQKIAVHVPHVGGDKCQETFTGTSSHVTYAAATLHATIEVLKRDAFMIAWYRKRKLDIIELPDIVPNEIGQRMEYLRAHGLELTLFDLRADLPLSMVMLQLRATRQVGNWPKDGRLIVPAGGFGFFDALRHAVTLSCSRFVGIGLDDSPERNPLQPSAVDELAKTNMAWGGLARYLVPSRAALFDLLSSGNSIPASDLDAGMPTTSGEQMTALRSWLGTANLDWLAVPLDDAHTSTAGLHVVKVVIPGAIPLTISGEAIDRQHPRFLKSWKGAANGSFNDAPHPLY